MRRREFFGLLGGAAAWPMSASAQQPAIPVIGLLNTSSPETYSERLRAFRQSLRESGYVEGESVTIEYRWAENQADRLAPLADELIQRRVALIVTTGGPASALAAKAATTTIPIVFNVNEDPVRLGLIASLARPGGNLTGTNIFLTELTAKRLELLRELLPATKRVAALLNPQNAITAETTTREILSAAQALELQVEVLKAGTSREIDTCFDRFGRERFDALFIAADPYFASRRIQIVQHAAHQSIPVVYGVREFADVGGLISYGTSLTEGFRQIGIYAGRILKGAKPADLPVVQSGKLELVINAQTARMLGLTVPPALLARADDVIE
jgi:putative ABC transport system substrate-binding protein